jgi:hypothetical protein
VHAKVFQENTPQHISLLPASAGALTSWLTAPREGQLNSAQHCLVSLAGLLPLLLLESWDA